MQHTKYLIIGCSAAGISAANCLAKLEPEARILCVTAEQVKPYNKCFLVDWLVGEKQRAQLDLQLNPVVEILLGLKVISLDVQAKIAYLSNNTQISYEKALLAIGAQAFTPAIEGLETAQAVFNFHDYQDVANLADFIRTKKPHTAVVIGAGLTGLECADALWRCGLKVTVLERSKQVLGKLVDQAGAQQLVDSMGRAGIDLRLETSVMALRLGQVVLGSSQTIPADLVVLAAGVRPNQLKILNGELSLVGAHVSVNSYLQTNLPDLWAAGDMIAAPEIVTGQVVPSCSWPDAMMQGNCAAQNMAGKVKIYPGMLQTANSHFFGQDFVSLGCLEPSRGPLGSKSTIKTSPDHYQKLVLDSSNQLKGALLIGDTAIYPALKRAILTGLSWDQ